MSEHQRCLSGQTNRDKQAPCVPDRDDGSDDGEVSDIEYAPSIEAAGTSSSYLCFTSLLIADC